MTGNNQAYKLWLCLLCSFLLLPLEIQAQKYNPQNEMFRLLGTKRSFSQNETFFFSHP